MKIFGFEINRNKENKKEFSKYDVARIIKEVGVPRDAVIDDYKTEENPDELDINTYIRMQQTDGTVQAIIRMLSLPIQSADTFINEDENDNGEADFIRTILFGSEYEGGMSTPMQLVIADMTRAIAEGFRAYNKVPQVITQGDYKGMIGWRKIAPRDAQTIKIKVDKHGGFNGLHQMATLGEQTIDKNIPKDYALLYTFQNEKHGLYGESILKSAYYHYDKKHKLYYIACKKAEVESMGIRTIKLPQAPNADDRTAIESAVDNIGVNTRISVPDNYDFDVKFPTNAGSDFIMKNIEHHDLLMAKSALCGMLELNGGGSYALSKDKSNWLVMAINGIMRNMEATINSYVIAPLINYNYGTYNYPKFKFAPITTEAEDLLNEVAKSVFSKAELLPTDVFQNVVNRAVEKMGIKQEPKEATKELEKIEKESDDKKEIENLIEEKKDNVDLAEKENMFWREKNKYEKSVSFEDIEERMDLKGVDLEEKLSPIFKKQRAQLKVAVKKAIKNNDIKSIKKLKLIGQDKMQEIMLEEIQDTFEFSKRKAADDEKAQSPKTSKKTETTLKAKAKEYADIHEDSVKESTIKFLEEALKDKNLKLEEKKIEEEIIEEEFDLDEFAEEVIEKNKPLSDGVITGLSATAITYAVNAGRDEYFQSVKKDTYAYQYSAILDSSTCNRCLSLDGRVIEPNDPSYTEQMPSLHSSCRCLWIRIDKSEDDLPKITGVPESIPTDFNEIPKYPTLRKDQKSARIEIEKRIKRLERKVKKYETSETYPNRVKSLSKTISGLKRAL